MINVLIGVGIGLGFLFIMWSMITYTFQMYLGGEDEGDDEDFNKCRQEGFKSGVDYSMVMIKELFKKEDLLVTNWDTLYGDLINKDRELVKNPDSYIKLLEEYKTYVKSLSESK